MKPDLVNQLNAAVSALSGTGVSVDMTYRNMPPQQFQDVKEYYRKSGAIESENKGIFSVTLRPMNDYTTVVSVDFVQSPSALDHIMGDVMGAIQQITFDYAKKNGIDMKHPGDAIDEVMHQNEKP